MRQPRFGRRTFSTARKPDFPAKRFCRKSSTVEPIVEAAPKPEIAADF
jgi:hypothetical protein